MKGMLRQPMSVSQPIYWLWEIAHLPCTYITDISREILKCWCIIQLSISRHLTCNCTVVTQVFELELFYLIHPSNRENSCTYCLWLMGKIYSKLAHTNCRYNLCRFFINLMKLKIWNQWLVASLGTKTWWQEFNICHLWKILIFLYFY